MLFECGVAAKRLFCALALTAPVILPAAAQERPLNAVLLDRLCAKTMRANEEDRFLGTVSIAVRTTIKYEGGVFSPDLIDDAVQEVSQAIVEACPKIAETDDAHRLGVVVGIVHDTTRRLLADGSRRYEPRQLDDATAADLSEELSSQEIDAWLDGLPPRQRALALFLYASDVREAEIASAIGLSVIALPRAVAATKTDLLTFFRQELPDTTQSAERASMQYRIVAAGREPPAGRGPRSRQALAAQGREEPAIENAAAVQAAEPGQGDAVRMRITGISSELYSGWSLLATVSGLPRTAVSTFASRYCSNRTCPGASG